MKTLVITGGSGTVGTRLKTILSQEKYNIRILTRNEKKVAESEEFWFWDPQNSVVDDRFITSDIVINLAGAGIADDRWTPKRKKLILDSRVDSTKLLVDYAEEKKMKWDAFISASAIGYYGDGGQKILTEDSGVITDEFLSRVCVSWENEAKKAERYSKQLSIIRIGTVLSQSGGALEKMSKTIPFGVANYLGSGNQLMSWIHIDDLCRMINFILENQLSGIYNAVAPDVRSNKEFTKVLRDEINHLAIVLPAPKIALKIALGEMSKVVLNSSNVSSNKIEKSGFTFQYGQLETALADIYK